MVAAVARVVGAGRVGVRLISPYTEHVGTRRTRTRTRSFGLHMARVVRAPPSAGRRGAACGRCSRDAFRGTFVVAGAYARGDGGRAVADGYADLVACVRAAVPGEPGPAPAV